MLYHKIIDHIIDTITMSQLEYATVLNKHSLNVTALTAHIDSQTTMMYNLWKKHQPSLSL